MENEELVLECKSCGNEFSPNIKYSMLGAPYVTCPFCKTKVLLSFKQYQTIKSYTKRN